MWSRRIIGCLDYEKISGIAGELFANCISGRGLFTYKVGKAMHIKSLKEKSFSLMNGLESSRVSAVACNHLLIVAATSRLLAPSAAGARH